MHDLFEPGSVWLVGAGPGDPDLLTRKAERLIRAADVVLYDALVGPGVLNLVPAHVERIGVGKRSGRHSKNQEAICALIVAQARAGKRVVRLKGGDPAIFGRAAEEIDACTANGIPVRICPGITAASAAVVESSVCVRVTRRRIAAPSAASASAEVIRPRLAVRICSLGTDPALAIGCRLANPFLQPPARPGVSVRWRGVASP